jgi:hypothetical protein
VVYRVPAITNPESGGAGPDREAEQPPGGQIIPLCGGSAVTALGQRAARRSGQGAGKARARIRALCRRL